MWPTAATTPASTICSIAASAPSRSGAMVTIRMAPPPASRTRSISPGPGRASGPAEWAPHRCGGQPRALPGGCRRSARRATSSASTPTCLSNSVGPAVTSEATSAVVPCLRCNATAVAVSARTAAEKFAPPPPCRWVSTKPGTTVTAPSSRSATPRRSGLRPMRAHDAVGDVDPAGPQQFSAGQQRVGGDQHDGAQMPCHPGLER